MSPGHHLRVLLASLGVKDSGHNPSYPSGQPHTWGPLGVTVKGVTQHGSLQRTDRSPDTGKGGGECSRNDHRSAATSPWSLPFGHWGWHLTPLYLLLSASAGSGKTRRGASSTHCPPRLAPPPHQAPVKPRFITDSHKGACRRALLAPPGTTGARWPDLPGKADMCPGTGSPQSTGRLPGVEGPTRRVLAWPVQLSPLHVWGPGLASWKNHPLQTLQVQSTANKCSVERCARDRTDLDTPHEPPGAPPPSGIRGQPPPSEAIVPVLRAWN